MKKLIVLSLAICMFSSCYAQKAIQADLYKINGKRFKVTDYGAAANSDKIRIGINNPDYKYENVPPPLPKVEFPYPMQKKDIHLDNDKVKKIIFEVLKSKLKYLKINSEILSLSFSLSENGTVLNINYFLNQKTYISVKDIAEIDERIKSEIRVNFTGVDYLQYYVINYSMPAIFFGKL
ncbi:hypothetical protein [Pedobacter rhodius]|uniref:Uncharacterized protein n=1 Tax=Pedobacter rhodius TaxID=3004098 RepID=A0ABT4L031_9SPHI|nr:hypothetical protein [Pedobacter sp. SJ11]MCZ4224541.1 hypothetical protein [Pedobacter sp. SJ11]